VFIHGFNVTFEDALLRAAQLKYDLNFSGEIVLFTWPSRGGGPRQRPNIRVSSGGVSRLDRRRSLAPRPLAGTQHGRPRIPRRIHGPRHAEKGLEQIVMVTADVRTDLFAQQFPKFAALGDGKTPYVASKDLALWASSKIVNLSGRIGNPEKGPFVIDGVDTVDASTIDRGLSRPQLFQRHQGCAGRLGLSIRQ
jgi:esterase/lipase superfamily enzyme